MNKKLTDYLWKIVREIIKANIENNQNIIIECCYIPFNWNKDYVEISEDIVQIIFLKIFRLEKEKLPTNNAATWVYSVTKNVTLNFLKSKKEELNIDELYYITSENKELNEIIEIESNIQEWI